MFQDAPNIFDSPFAAGRSIRQDGLEPAQRITLLLRLAETLHAHRDDVLSICSEETSLTREELEPEFARMTGTLRLFADLLREGSWVRAAIDTAPHDDASRAACVGPPHDVRRMLVAIGRIAGVLGASNFPLAYGVCGGDTASALAAGLSVIVKEHPAHPRTGRLLAKLAHDASAPLAYVTHEDPTNFQVVQELIDAVDGVGFTGSPEGGLAIEKLAQARRIPAFCEMGSVNVVVVGAHSLRTSAREIAHEVAASILARVGQQCTRPGYVLVDDAPESETFIRTLASTLAEAPARRMLSPAIAQRYKARCEELRQHGLRDHAADVRSRAVSPGSEGLPALFELDLEEPVSECFVDVVTREVFGPAAIVVRGLTREVLIMLEGRIATAIYDAVPSITRNHHFMLAARISGRVTCNSVPTGVRVCHAMVHGGPFPATNAPHTTAVGPMAIERWCRPVCYQNCPDDLLPEELQDANPRGIMRVLNGVWTRDAARR